MSRKTEKAGTRKAPSAAMRARDTDARSVERRAILHRVFFSPASGIVILQAPAGHGKSVAMAQIRLACEQRQIRTGWLHLEASDNDSRRHAAHLRLLLSQLAGARTAKPRARRPAPDARLAQRADWLIDELAGAGQEIALFVDEFEVLGDRSVLTFWRNFLQHCPGNVRVFIASRLLPELGLTRLLVANRLLLLSAEDLRFSGDEVREFFRLRDEIEIQAGEVDTIYRRSEGWPAAVQLFCLGLSSAGARRSLRDLDQFRPRQLTEYLTECVLESQPAEVRDFLLRSSILLRLNAALCDQVTDRADSRQILDQLERQGLFIRALDTARTWFQYHPLFSALLQDQLAAAEPRSIPELHRRAAAWLRDAGQWEDAMRSAIAGQDLDGACVMLREWSSRLIAGGEMATVVRWLEQLPDRTPARDLPFTIRMVWSLIFTGRPVRLARELSALEELRARAGETSAADESSIVRAGAAMCADHIEEAASLMAAVEPIDRALDGFEAFEQGAAENLRAYLSIFRGHLATAHIHLSRARSFNEQGGATFSGGYTACFEGALLILEGRTKAALDRLRSGLDEQRRVLDASFVSAAIASCYVWALYEVGELAMVEAAADEYRDLLIETAVPDYFAVGQICLARTRALRGRGDEAADTLEHAQFVAARNGWTRIVETLAVEQLALSLRPDPQAVPPGDARGLLEACARHRQAWLTPAGELLGSSCFLVGERLAGRGDEPPESGAPRAPYEQLRRLVAQALSADKEAASIRFLNQALALGARSGLIRPLLDHGPALVSLLQRAVQIENPSQGTRSREFLMAVCRAAGLPAANPEARRRTGVSPRLADFTPRERDILGFLAARLPTKEIAQRVFLSDNTVKYHLKNIFSKLAVSSRREAVAVLSRLDLSC